MESGFILKERTVVIHGELNSVTQALMTRLTTEGADVVLIGSHAQNANKFCAQLTDQREVNSKYGRAASIQSQLIQPDQIKDVLGQVAQSFGGIDIYIDAQMNFNPSAIAEVNTESLKQMIDQGLLSTVLVSQQIISFFKGRKRGRMMYFMLEPWTRGMVTDVVQSAVRGGVSFFVQGLSHQLQDSQVSVNGIIVGLTEEYLLGHYPGVPIKEALELHKSKDAHAKITESEKIANVVSFLCSPSGAAMNGQCLRLV